MLKKSCRSRSSNGGYSVPVDQLNDDSICNETDLFSYDWPGLDNLEDIDDLFRSCDSSFGLDIDISDNLRWFPSSTFDLPSYSPRAVDAITEQLENFDALPRVSNQPQSIASSRDVSIEKHPSSENMKKRKLDQCSFTRNTEKSNENEGEADSTKQDSSCITSVVDESSTDATSLKQLQDVMLQLDKRTKLCIRDSLYRLARSASRRHNSDDNDATGGGLLSDGINKCNGLTDIETDTNPIDRSIAHLLFHRPAVK